MEQFQGRSTAIDKVHETDANSGAMAMIARVVGPDFPHHVVQREGRLAEGKDKQMKCIVHGNYPVTLPKVNRCFYHLLVLAADALVKVLNRGGID